KRRGVENSLSSNAATLSFSLYSVTFEGLMRNFIVGFVAAVVLGVAVVYFYFATGSAPAAVSAQAMPFEKKLARMSLHKRVEKEAPKDPPFQATPQIYMSAAHEYVEHCAICHGLPGKPQPDLGANMLPY